MKDRSGSECRAGQGEQLNRDWQQGQEEEWLDKQKRQEE